MLRVAPLVVALVVLGAVAAPADEEPAHVVRYENNRLTVHVTDVPLDRLMNEIAAATNATLRGTAPARTGSFDFTALPLADGLARIFGAESFMLTYGSGGSVRMIELFDRGVAAPMAMAPAQPTPASHPLADAEQQAAVLQRPVSAALPPALAASIGSDTPPVGRVLHAAVQEADPSLRSAARDAVFDAMTKDPEIATAYLSTLKPVDDAVLANTLRNSSAPGAAEEWMLAVSMRAPSYELRAKAASVIGVWQSQAAQNQAGQGQPGQNQVGQ